MRNGLRLIKLSELDFLACFKYGLYGRESNYLKGWKVDENLVFVVDDHIAGCATVKAACFYSSGRLWENNDYPYRLPISFTKVFPRGKRPSFEKHRKELEEVNGRNWGLCFVNKRPVHDEIAFSIIQNIKSHKSYPEEILKDIDLNVARELNIESRQNLEKAKKLVKATPKEDNEVDQVMEKLVLRLIEFCHNDPDTFSNDLSYDSFVRTLDEEELEDLEATTFAKLKIEAGDCMRKQGLFRPLWVEYGPGTYVVIGDSHGEYTKQGMWDLVRTVSDLVEADKIFHIGHVLDDNGLLSNELSQLDNVVVVTRIEEAYEVEKYVRSFEREPFAINRDGVMLGQIRVANQDTVTDYMRPRPAGKVMRKGAFKEASILNHHCLEFDVADSDDDDPKKLFAFPGCLCEKHVDGRKRKRLKYHEGILDEVHSFGGYHSRYHRRKFMMKEEWTQGLFVVHIKEDLGHTIVPCSIKRIFVNGKEEYATSYFDKIVTESGCYDPEEKYMVVTDVHAPLHDPNILDVQEQLAIDYRPDFLVNLGDMRNGEGLNHHKWEKQEVVTEKLLDEAVSVFGIMKRMSRWAPKCYILLGNHERFANDLSSKLPQFKGLVDFDFLCSPKNAGHEVVGLQEKLQFGNLVFIHGDIHRGSAAILFDFYSDTYPGKTVVMGHLHFPAIRGSCHMVGYAGQRDQHYNAKTISKWCHGVGLVNRFADEVWVTTLAIEDSSIYMNGSEYKARETDSWRTFPWKPELRFVDVDQESPHGMEG